MLAKASFELVDECARKVHKHNAEQDIDYCYCNRELIAPFACYLAIPIMQVEGRRNKEENKSDSDAERGFVPGLKSLVISLNPSIALYDSELFIFLDFEIAVCHHALTAHDDLADADKHKQEGWQADQYSEVDGHRPVEEWVAKK